MNQTKMKKAHPAFILMIVLVLASLSISLMLDPNSMDHSGAGGYKYKFTLTRLQGGGLGIVAILLYIAKFVDEQNKVKAYRKCWVIGIPIVLVGCFASSLVSVIFRTCWGLWESVYIDDPWMLFFEYCWLCFSGLLGPFLYYRYIFQDKWELFFKHESNKE